MIRVLAWIATLALMASPAIARPPEIYRISIPGSVPAYPLMGFSITVDNGQVARLPVCPAGWAVDLLNDPNWRSTLDAHALVGAASLSIRMLPRLLLVSGVPAADVLDGKSHIRSWGKLTFMRDGELFTVAAPRIDLLPIQSSHH